MKNPNLRAIRQQLPHGSISLIAEHTGIPASSVSDFFNKGLHQNYSAAILKEAVDIIQAKYPDESLLDTLEEYGLSGGSPLIRKKKKHNPVDSGDDGGLGLILAAIAGGLIMFWPQIKGMIKK